jgi:hypothetical protein
MHSCQEFRDGWLADALDRAGGPYLNSLACPDCDTWRAQLALQVRALTSLRTLALPATHTAPTELHESRVEPTVELESPVQRCLDGLTSLKAPESLFEQVAADLRSPANHSIVETESFHSPSVLERLVNEELADPLAHQSARIIGRLDSQKAPAELQDMVARDLAAIRSRIQWRGWATFMAACFVGWIVVNEVTSEDPAPGRRFEIVHAETLVEFSKLGRAHLEIMSGGASPISSTTKKGQR